MTMERKLATVLTMDDNNDVVVVLTDSDGVPQTRPVWKHSMDDALDWIETLSGVQTLLVTPLAAPGQYTVAMLLSED